VTAGAVAGWSVSESASLADVVGNALETSNASLGMYKPRWCCRGVGVVCYSRLGRRPEMSIAFASCKLTATQSVMSTIEREAYAVIYALWKLRFFL